jgi:myo-inositol-hexaphosphate 3-phosphohydrolase
MIKKLFLIILFALLLCSCQKENKYKVYMKNGNIIYAWYVHSNNVGRTEIIDKIENEYTHKRNRKNRNK